MFSLRTNFEKALKYYKMFVQYYYVPLFTQEKSNSTWFFRKKNRLDKSGILQYPGSFTPRCTLKFVFMPQCPVNQHFVFCYPREESCLSSFWKKEKSIPRPPFFIVLYLFSPYCSHVLPPLLVWTGRNSIGARMGHVERMT